MINQAGTPKRPEIPAKDFAETMGTDPIAILPFDPALFGQAANNGQMLIELQPKAAGSEAVRRLARALTGRTARRQGQAFHFAVLVPQDHETGVRLKAMFGKRTTASPCFGSPAGPRRRSLRRKRRRASARSSPPRRRPAAQQRAHASKPGPGR